MSTLQVPRRGTLALVASVVTIGACAGSDNKPAPPVADSTGTTAATAPSRTVEKHARMIPGAKFVLYKNAGQFTSWDATDANVKDVREFARVVEKL